MFVYDRFHAIAFVVWAGSSSASLSRNATRLRAVAAATTAASTSSMWRIAACSVLFPNQPHAIREHHSSGNWEMVRARHEFVLCDMLTRIALCIYYTYGVNDDYWEVIFSRRMFHVRVFHGKRRCVCSIRATRSPAFHGPVFVLISPLRKEKHRCRVCARVERTHSAFVQHRNTYGQSLDDTFSLTEHHPSSYWTYVFQ